jgi:hypothetical protein
LARSYTKQIVGREVSNGLFRFFEVGGSGELGPVELFDASAGEQRNEPVQRAVRWLVDLATYDITATLTKTKETCDAQLAPVEQEDVAEATDVAVETVPVLSSKGVEVASMTAEGK